MVRFHWALIVDKLFSKKSFIHGENPGFNGRCVNEVIDFECQLLFTVLISSEGLE